MFVIYQGVAILRSGKGGLRAEGIWLRLPSRTQENSRKGSAIVKGNRLGTREEKKEPPRDTPAYHMFKLHGMVAVKQNDCWVKWRVDGSPWPEGGSFDLPVVQNRWKELLRRHKRSSKKTPVNWLGFGLWQEEAIERSSTAKQATLAGKVLKLQGN